MDKLVELWWAQTGQLVMLNVIGAYAPQVGCIREEKEGFWLNLDETVEKIPTNERILVGADLNGHVREDNNDDEE